MPQGFRRPISIIERIWLAADQISPPFAVQAVFEGHGQIDGVALRAAVAVASAANPGSRLVLKGLLRRAYWQDSGITPPVRHVNAAAWDGYSPENAPFLTEPLSAQGPACEVLVLEGSMPRLIFRAHHGVMDARGVYTWAEDVFRVLRGVAPLGARSPQTEADVATAVTQETRPLRPVPSIAPTGRMRPEGRGPAWKRITLEGSFPRILLGKAGWAVAQSAWQHGDGPVRLAIPVDLRPRCPGLRSTGNICMALHIDVTKGSTPSSINNDVWRQLRNKHDCMFFEGGAWVAYLPIRLLAGGLKLLCQAKHRAGVYDYTALLSHLGIVDTSLYSGGGFFTDTTFVVPPCVDGIPAFVVLTGTAGRLEITASMPPVLAGDGRLDGLLLNISRALEPARLPAAIPAMQFPGFYESPA